MLPIDVVRVVEPPDEMATAPRPRRPRGGRRSRSARAVEQRVDQRRGRRSSPRRTGARPERCRRTRR